MEKIIDKFVSWQKEHPDEDYQCDEIFEFANSLGRGDMLMVFEYLVSSHHQDDKAVLDKELDREPEFVNEDSTVAKWFKVIKDM